MYVIMSWYFDTGCVTDIQVAQVSRLYSNYMFIMNMVVLQYPPFSQNNRFV